MGSALPATQGSVASVSSYTFPKVYIILLNWNQTSFTLACLRSLARVNYPNLGIVLVDNGSQAGSLNPIMEEFPKLDVICLERNLGFTGGNNAGIQRARLQGADYIMLLNNDTEVAPDLLERLVTFAEAHPRCAVVGPLIYYYDEPQRIWSAGGAVDPHTGMSTSLAEGELDDSTRHTSQVDYVSGCALLIRRTVVEQVGLLDDRFFIYYEETDWCARVREHRHEIWIVPQGHVWHKISPQARAASPRYEYLMTRNRLLYLRKRGVSRMHLISVLLTRELRVCAAWSLWPRYRDRRELRVYRLRGIWDFLRGHFGEPAVATVLAAKRDR